jgi:aromatic ring-opening dioxygenase catalytic subunit (LigB family)
VISAHWEEQEVTIMSQEHPQLLFDYFGFPKHTYELTYPAPSSPSLAREIQELLTQKGIISKIDSKRGYDHGVFVPFKLIYPEAQIPIVQVSLKRSLNPQDHLELGKALAPLRDEGVLIVGSGMSYHNLREFFGGNSVGRVSDEFDAWLTESVTANDPDFRNERLLSWKEAPSAKLAHPREEHLIPLLVVAGAAGTDLGSRIFVDRVMGATISAYQFGE